MPTFFAELFKLLARQFEQVCLVRGRHGGGSRETNAAGRNLHTPEPIHLETHGHIHHIAPRRVTVTCFGMVSKKGILDGGRTTGRVRALFRSENVEVTCDPNALIFRNTFGQCAERVRVVPCGEVIFRAMDGRLTSISLSPVI